MNRKNVRVILMILLFAASAVLSSCGKFEIIIRKVDSETETEEARTASRNEEDSRDADENESNEEAAESDEETIKDSEDESPEERDSLSSEEQAAETSSEEPASETKIPDAETENPAKESEAPSSEAPEPASESNPEDKPELPYVHYEAGKVGENIHVGDTVILGSFEQDNERADGPEPLQWLVIREEKDRLLLLSVYSLNNLPYDEDHELSNWTECSLNRWLNGNFYESSFTEAEKEFIAYVDMKDGYPSASQSTHSGGRIFCLSKSDLENAYTELPDRRALNSLYADVIMKRAMLQHEYYPNTEEEVNRKREEWNKNYGEYCSWWWIREPAGWYVHANGEIREGTDCRDLNSVRPVMWVVR